MNILSLMEESFIILIQIKLDKYTLKLRKIQLLQCPIIFVTTIIQETRTIATLSSITISIKHKTKKIFKILKSLHSKNYNTL